MSYSLIYPDFIDAATGKTLVVTPGSAYTVRVASGRNTAMPSYPNDGRWTNATTFLNLSVEEPKPQVPATAKPSTEPDASTPKDKDKGGA